MNYVINTFTDIEFKRYINNNVISHSYHQTISGKLKVAIVDMGICEASFADHLPDNFTNEPNKNIKRLLLVGTEFQLKVWEIVLQIPSGQTSTYQKIAQEIGHPKSWRAVANALGQNKIAYFIPCHRVLRKDGQLGGYKWGVQTKLKLLESECAYSNKFIDIEPSS